MEKAGAEGAKRKSSTVGVEPTIFPLGGERRTAWPRTHGMFFGFFGNCSIYSSSRAAEIWKAQTAIRTCLSPKKSQR